MAFDIYEGLIIEKRLTYAQMKALVSPIPGTVLKPSDMSSIYKYDNVDWRAQEIENAVIINRVEDFPGYSSGEIVLADNTLYHGFNRATPFNVTDKITVGNNVVIAYIRFGTSNVAGLNFSGSANILASAYYYSGTGTAITCNQSTNDKIIRIARSNLVAASTGTTFFNMVTTGTGSFLILDELAMIGIGRTVPTEGTATGVLDGFIISIPIINVVGYSTGLFIRNAVDSEVSIRFGGYSSNAAGALLNYDDGDYNTVNIEKCVFPLDTNEYAYNFKDTETFTGGVNVSGGVVTVSDRVFLAGSFTNKSVGFNFENVLPNIADSVISSQMEFETATPETTIIPATNAWVILNVGAVTLKKTILERVAIANDGVATYLDKKNIALDISGKVVIKPATATYSLECRFFWFCNGEFTVTFDNTTNRMNRVGIGSEVTTDYPIVLYRSAGTPPAELKKTEIYWPVNINPDYVQLSYTENGAAITITDDGTGTLYYSNADLPGGKGRASISTFTEINPSALLPLKTGYDFGLALRNTDAKVDIKCEYAFYKNKE